MSVGVFVRGHGFVGCEAAGYLDELDYEQHGDPDELEVGPEGEDDGEGVCVEGCAEGGGEECAFD